MTPETFQLLTVQLSNAYCTAQIHKGKCTLDGFWFGYETVDIPVDYSKQKKTIV